MGKHGTLRFRPIKIIEYAWALFLILNGNSVYHAAIYIDYHFPLICTALTILLWIITPPTGKFGKKKNLLMAIVAVCYFAVYFVLKNQTVAKEIYLSGFIISIPVLMLYFQKLHRLGEPERVFYRIETVVLVLAALSLVLWLLGPMLNVISPNCGIAINWGRERVVDGYFGLQFITQKDDTFSFGIIRNTGIFCEAPMFNLWLSISLATEMFLKSSISKKKVLLLCVTILTTTSTTGILFIVICFVLYAYLQTKSSKAKTRLAILAVCLCIFPIGISVIQSVLSLKSETSSYSIRMQDYIAGVTVWLENPIFGTGYGDISSLFLFKTGTSKGFSNSITAILATGGLYHFVIYLLGIFAPMLGHYENKAKIVCFILCYAFLSVVTIFFARYILVVFVTFGLSYLPYMNTQRHKRKI